MAGRKEARIFASIWRDRTFLERSAREQRMYFFLLSQPDLSFCGVISLRMRRWARSATDLTVADVQEDLEGLAQTDPANDTASEGERPLIVVDEDTEEVFLRSLIRHDRIWKIPNLLKAAREAATLIESPKILAELLEELHRLPLAESSSSEVRQILRAFMSDLAHRLGDEHDTPPKGSADPAPNPSAKGSAEGSPNPSGNGQENDVPASDERTDESAALPGMPDPEPLKAPEPGSDDDPDWVKFWAVYPNRSGKAEARRAWAKAVKKAAPFVIIAGAEKYTELVTRQRRDKQHIKHASGWLNNERWNDEIPAPPTSGSHLPPRDSYSKENYV